MLEPIWIDITKALHTGETVHIIVYNEQEQTRVETPLLENEVRKLKICPTNKFAGISEVYVKNWV